MCVCVAQPYVVCCCLFRCCCCGMGWVFVVVVPIQPGKTMKSHQRALETQGINKRAWPGSSKNARRRRKQPPSSARFKIATLRLGMEAECLCARANSKNQHNNNDEFNRYLSRLFFFFFLHTASQTGMSDFVACKKRWVRRD